MVAYMPTRDPQPNVSFEQSLVPLVVRGALIAVVAYVAFELAHILFA